MRNLLGGLGVFCGDNLVYVPYLHPGNVVLLALPTNNERERFVGFIFLIYTELT